MAELHETKLKFDIGRWLPSIGREMSEAEFLNRAVTAFAEMYESIEAFESEWDDFKNKIQGAIVAAQDTANGAMTLAENTADGLETTNGNLATTDATVASNTGRIDGAENELADVNENIEDLQNRVSELEDRPSGWTSEQITLLENFKNSLNTLLDNMGYTGTNGDSVADACIATLTALIANLRGTTPTVYYTVSFNIGGHGIQPPQQNIIAGGLATNPGNLSESGWTFGGWYADGSFSTLFDFATTQINANTTVYAKWTEVTPETRYTVSFDISGHGTQPAAQSVIAGGYATNPGNLTASGWVFGGWYTSGSFTTAFDFANTAINADTVVYAKWTAEETEVVAVSSTWKQGDSNHDTFTTVSGDSVAPVLTWNKTAAEIAGKTPVKIVVENMGVWGTSNVYTRTNHYECTSTNGTDWTATAGACTGGYTSSNVPYTQYKNEAPVVSFDASHFLTNIKVGRCASSASGAVSSTKWNDCTFKVTVTYR